MAGGRSQSRTRDARESRERARAYDARIRFHAGRERRRRRDNLIACIAGAVLVVASIGGQVAYYTAGPGVPAPTPTTSATTPAVTPPAIP